MAVEQSRIYELLPYLNTLDANEVMISVDHASFPLPKRFSLASLATGTLSGATHIESGRLTGLSSRSVAVTFDEAFDNQPVGDVEVYRMEEVATGMYRKNEVLFGFIDANQPTTTGFSLTIDSSESLTNIVIEYKFL